ncbi:MAG: hypothetical protein A3J83_05460 [Elusimicrobia bacterium RIFOXYA2_FULL_40_6]|nr:MAG: hypothetical protein A3J83_05460 [Elusimicrobia bacterium RIFOXYA2_FULL_40_6]
MVSKLPRKARDKSLYANYLKKALQFEKAMNECFTNKDYDASALNGIHSIISGIDAVLVFNHGIISASYNHEDAIGLLIELIPDSKPSAKHALAVIREKTTVEYLDDLCDESDASEIIKHTERFMEWVKTKLPR